MSRFFYLVFFLLSRYFDCSTLPWWWVVLQPNTAHGHSIGIGSEPVNAPEMCTFFHFFTLTERMAVAILEEVNNHTDAEFKRLKDIGSGHTIYLNERNGSG